MAQQKNKNNRFLNRMLAKYRLTIIRDHTYKEVLNLKLTRLNVLILSLSIVIFITLIISAIIVYTPVKQLIPGVLDPEVIEINNRNYYLLDSLAKELTKYEFIVENQRRIFSGEEPDNLINTSDTGTTYDYSYTNYFDDSLYFQTQTPEKYIDKRITNFRKNGSSLSKILFFPPVKGLITNTFNASSNHYGVDLVVGPNEVVKAALDGTVIMATWTLETGNVIQIQHENNLLSVYKHNAELNLEQGDYVKAGDPIAIVGNSGELTTGPHLHFELWHDGTPLNPLDYISFK